MAGIVQAVVQVNGLGGVPLTGRQCLAVHSGPLGIVHCRQVCGVVSRCRLSVIRHGSGAVGNDIYSLSQANIPAGSTNHNIKQTGLYLPVLQLHIIKCEGALGQGNGDFLLLPGFQEHFLKGTQLLLGTEDGALLIGHINLCDLCAVHIAGVLDLKGNGQVVRVLNIGGGQLQIAVFKSGIRQAVTEREQHFFLCGVIVAVANVHTLFMLADHRLAGIVAISGIILKGQRIRLGGLTAGTYGAGQNTSHSLAAGLAGQATVQQRLCAVQPGHVNNGTACQHHHGVGIGSSHLLDQLIMIGGHFNIRAVIALALKLLGQTGKHHSHIRSLSSS